MPQRRYDLDWLRIAAFALLILYHLGMVFVPWDFHIKTAQPQRWLEPVMLLSNAWRLSLLFLIAGIASRAMLANSPGAARFARSRTARLFIPLVAGMALWVAPQAWVDLTVNHGYTRDFAAFWRHDNFRFDESLGIMLPTWNHLWFVAYLWVYSLVLAALLCLPAGWRAAGQRSFDRLFAGPRAVLLPILYIAAVRIALADRFPETHALTDDWCAHLLYGFAFAFGVGLGPAHPIWATIAKFWKPVGLAAIAGFAIVAAVNILLPEDATLPPLQLAAVRLARAVQAWGSIIALLGFAQRFWQANHPWRATLSEAVFPAYIAHQTILILVMFWIKPSGWHPAVEFATLLAATVAGCAAFTLIGRQIPWARPFMGLAPQRRTTPSWPNSQALRSTPPA